MRRLVPILACVFWLTAAVPCLAAPLAVPTQRLSYDADLRQMLAGIASTASAQVVGKGEAMVLRYTSALSLDTLIFLRETNGVPDIATGLRAVLPPGTDQEAALDLTRSTAWTPGERTYHVFILTASASGATVSDARLTLAHAWQLPVIAVRQLFSPESYQPSSYHRLQGYAIFGMPVTVVAGMVLLLCAGGAWIIGGAERMRRAVMVLLVGFLLYQARFSLDLLRFTRDHLGEWHGRQTYLQAGSSFAVADAVRAQDSSTGTVLVCHDGTSYVPTLLQYLVYPLQVSTDPLALSGATLAVVTERIAAGVPSATRAHCGARDLPAQLLRTFPDGSALYRLRPRAS